jgi:hypothetical protein
MLDQKKTVNTSKIAPLIPADVRQDFYYCGLTDELRGTYDAIRYSMHQMSESEFQEIYQNGSRQYQIAVGLTIQSINAKAGK